MSNSQQIAEMLLQSKAVGLNPHHPYRYSSGLLSPIYCDNRILISFPQYRKIIITALANIIQHEALPCDVIAGTATAGIPWAAWLADHLNKPMVYVRSKAKEHGKGNQIEGFLPKNQQVLIIEDLISTGASVINCVHTLRQADAQVNVCLAIFSYELLQSQQALQAANLTCHSLCNISTLIDTAVKLQTITEQEKSMILDWQKQPEQWNL